MGTQRLPIIAIAVSATVFGCSGKQNATSQGETTAAPGAVAPAGSTAAAPAGSTATTPAGSTSTGGAAMAPAGANSVDLQPWQNSGVHGQATFAAEGNKTTVVAKLTNAPPGEHQGMLHQGSCQHMGAVAARLGALKVGADSTGTDSVTVNVPMSRLFDGNHFIAFHQAGGHPGKAVACTDLPKHSM